MGINFSSEKKNVEEWKTETPKTWREKQSVKPDMEYGQL